MSGMDGLSWKVVKLYKDTYSCISFENPQKFRRAVFNEVFKLLDQLCYSLVVYSMLEELCVELQNLILDVACTLTLWE